MGCTYIGREEKNDSTSRSLKSQASNQEDCEDQIGKSGSNVHSLQEKMKEKSGYFQDIAEDHLI